MRSPVGSDTDLPAPTCSVQSYCTVTAIRFMPDFCAAIEYWECTFVIYPLARIEREYAATAALEIKQHLQIKAFFGTNANAVKHQL